MGKNISSLGFIYDWCEERFEIQSIADDILAKFVPAHVNIFYCLGGILLTSFIFQGATGFALTIYYQPTVVEAFPSLRLILYHVNLGWFTSIYIYIYINIEIYYPMGPMGSMGSMGTTDSRTGARKC